MSTRTKIADSVPEFKSLRDITYEKLRAAILEGKYAPSEWLKERNLADNLGVSTTPIKEALRRLEYEGLVVSIPLRGSYVAPNVDSTLAEMGMLRASLEGVAAKLAATKATNEDIKLLSKQLEKMERSTEKRSVRAAAEANTEFHEIIHNVGRNSFLNQMLEIVRTFDQAFRIRALTDEEEMVQGLEDHKRIFEAIASHDPGLAETAMRKHILRTAEALHGKSMIAVKAKKT